MKCIVVERRSLLSTVDEIFQNNRKTNEGQDQIFTEEISSTRKKYSKVPIDSKISNTYLMQFLQIFYIVKFHRA